MAAKIFTLDEANRLLPEVERQLTWFREAVPEIVHLQDSIEVLELVGAGARQAPDHGDLVSQRAHLDDLVQTYNQRLEEFDRLGCLIKDLGRGLVDFYAQRDGRLVFLCWCLGEPTIRSWHEISAGFAGRRPISEW